jgi:hypothetical protein
VSAPTTGLAEPGVYDGIPNDVYHADPVPEGSLSSSGARLLLPPSCPALFRYWQDHGEQTKPAYDLGHAVHLLVLGEGAALVRIEAEDWRTKKAREQRDAAYAAGKVPLLAEAHDTATAMAAVMLNHHIAGPLFDQSTGKPEQTLIWRDPETLVMCRARFDWLRNPTGGRLIIPDLKTTYCAEPRSLAKSMVNFGYNLQGAFYENGAIELGLSDGPPAFVLVAQEKTPPYLVTIAQPDQEAIDAGRTRARKALDTYRRCRIANRWPGYADDIVPLPMPRWAAAQHENDYAAGDYDIEDD